MGECHLDINYCGGYDDYMRTTISIDPDNAAAIRRLVAEQGSGRVLKKVINDLLRLGIRNKQEADEKPVYEVEVLPVRFKEGIDLTSLNRLAVELEDEAAIHALKKDFDGCSGP